MSLLSDVLTVISAVGAAGAAVGSLMAARATKDGAEAALVRSFLLDYFSPDMSSSLRTLHQWRKITGESFASSWVDRLSHADPEAQKVDRARRFVKAYFEKASRLYLYHLISLKSYRAICDVAGNITYYDLVDSLELALNPGRGSTTLELMKKHLGRYKNAEKIRSVPPS